MRACTLCALAPALPGLAGFEGFSYDYILFVLPIKLLSGISTSGVVPNPYCRNMLV